MLTVEDLHETLEHEDHLGFGYACCIDLPHTKRDRLDRAIVAVANEEGFSKSELLTWSNSKHGRWLADLVMGNGYAPTRATVRRQLSREIVDTLVREEGGA
jgi:hypothetical protein